MVYGNKGIAPAGVDPARISHPDGVGEMCFHTQPATDVDFAQGWVMLDTGAQVVLGYRQTSSFPETKRAPLVAAGTEFT